MKVNVSLRMELSDPGARRTVEGLLSLCGITADEAGTGGSSCGTLRITDRPPLPAPEVLIGAEPDSGAEPRCTVLLVPPGTDPDAPEPGRQTGLKDGAVFVLSTPILLEEGAEMFAKVRAVFEGSGLSGENPRPRPPVQPPRESEPDARRTDDPNRDPNPPGQSPETPPASDFPVGADHEPERTPVFADTAGAGGVSVSPDGRSVSWRGRTVRLTLREAAYFLALYERRGEVVPRDALLRASGADSGSGSGSNLTDVYMGYLRKKLRPVFGEGAVLSVRGKGYLLNLPE